LKTETPSPSPLPISNQESGRPPTVTPPAGMVYIPGGNFQMGRRSGDYDSPPLTVDVAPFFIDQTEVTNTDYQKFIADTGHQAPPHWRKGKIPYGTEKNPVTNVTWNDASAYAIWANKRLPSESEWEFAARGTDGRLYPWGNRWSRRLANAGRGLRGRVFPVGNFTNGQSPFGVWDMSGNVWEWTSSDPINYADTSRKIFKGKVIRGGAYDVSRYRCTTTYRGFLPPDRAYDKTGFRCVRDLGR